MNEAILLKKYILDKPARNAEHVEAIGWVNSLEKQIQNLEQKQTKDKNGE